MRLRKTKRTYGCEINIAPLIDVVFLLIIFFMTVSQISRVEVEDLVLPEAAAGQPRPPVRRLIVNVHATGRRVVSGQDRSMASLARMLADAANEPGGGELSLLVRAPLAKGVGGLGLCTPSVFADTTDADYREWAPPG